MDSKEGEEGDRSFNEAVLEVQQQIFDFKERTSHKLQKLEDTIELARQKMQETLGIKAQRPDKGLVNAYGVKTNFTSGAEVFESLHDCEPLLAVQTIYDDEPVYDEEPGEGQECWPENEFILAALRGDNSDSSKPLQSEICTSERLEELAEFLYVQDFQQGQGKNILKNERIPIQLREVSSLIPISTETETVESFFNKRIVKDFLTIEIPYYFEMRSGNFGNMLIFDPGGQVQNKMSKDVNSKFKDMIKSEVKVEEAVMKISVRSQLKHWQDISLNFLAMEKPLKESLRLLRKVFINELGNSARYQGQNLQQGSDEFDKIVSENNQQYVDPVRVGQNVIFYWYNYIVFSQCIPEINKVMRIKYHKASRKGVVITIFDPGGILSFPCGSTWRRFWDSNYSAIVLQVVFSGKEFFVPERKSIAVKALLEMYVIQVKRSLEVLDPP